MGKKYTTKTFIEKAKAIHGDLYGYDAVEYTNNHTKIKVFCKHCKKYFEILPSNHLCSRGCSHSRSTRALTLEEFIRRAKEIHGDKYDYNEVKHKNMHTKVKIFCKKCKKYFYQTPDKHLQGHDCKCYLKQKQSVALLDSKEDFVKKAKLVHKDKYDYSRVNYINCNTKVCIICNRCHREFLQTPTKHLRGQGCSHCKLLSHGETLVRDYLENHNVDYKMQYRFKDCKDKNSLPFDFYLSSYNACIEYQGEQHYKSGKRFFLNLTRNKEKGKKEYKLRKKHDKIKRRYCKKNGITLLEIKYNENIEENLNKFFSFSKD